MAGCGDRAGTRPQGDVEEGTFLQLILRGTAVHPG